MIEFDTHPSAEILAQRRQAGTKGPRLDASIRPTSLAQGFAVQQAVIDIYGAEGDTVAGWKCLLPPPEKWVAGPIYASTLLDQNLANGDAAKLWPVDGQALIEPELTFKLGRDLPAREAPYTQTEIDEAIADVYMALELIDWRHTDPSQIEYCEALADGLSNQGLVVGPVLDRTKAFASANMLIEVTEGDGPTREFEGKHPNQNPVAPLYWLVNFLREQGVSLRKDQYVITGSYAGVIRVAFDKPVTIVYRGLSEMTVTFSALS